MQKGKLEDLEFLRIGAGVSLAGMIFNDNTNDTSYLITFPNETLNQNLVDLLLDNAEFKKFVRQTDLLETEIIDRDNKDGNGKNRKIVVRKSQRQIDQGVAWKVFKRDNYSCRYCGTEGIPMTIDHLLLWEHHGPTEEDNLVAACRKCNKTRGNLLYEDWLKHPFYLKVSKNLTSEQIEANAALVEAVKLIEPTKHTRKR